MKKLQLIILAIITFTGCLIAQSGSSLTLISEYIETLPENAEIAIGLIQNGEDASLGYRIKKGKIIEVENSNSVFEIGSITKTYTAALILQEVQSGNMSLYDPIAKHFSAEDDINTKLTNSITIKNLLTHTAGLALLYEAAPRPYWRSAFFARQNPHKFMKWKHYRKYLRRAKVEKMSGEKWTYSNAGFSILGQIMANKENTTWEELVEEKIFNPLGMNNTYTTGKNLQAASLVQGYDEEGNPSGLWDMQFVNAAGSIKSCVTDQLVWIKAHLQADKESVFETMKKDHGVSTAWENTSSGNSWFHRKSEEDHVIWHGGATGAYRSFLAFDEENQTGIVILINHNAHHPKMKDENNNSLIRKYGFEILKSLAKVESPGGEISER